MVQCAHGSTSTPCKDQSRAPGANPVGMGRTVDGSRQLIQRLDTTDAAINRLLTESSEIA